MSSSQAPMLTLVAAMIDPSYAKLKKPHHEFHHAWESKTLDEDHIMYTAMDAYLCLNIYKGWMKKQNPVAGSSIELSQIGKEGRGRSRGHGRGLLVRWKCCCPYWFYCSVKQTSCLVLFQGCVVLSPQQNYVYVLSCYLNSRTIVLVLCLTTILLPIGTTSHIFVFLLYIIRSY